MIDIHIKTIPHTQQRYDTCGDYWENPDGSIEVRISDNYWKDEMLIAIHELIELFLTRVENIDWKAIDAFDRLMDELDIPGEPGDNSDAPYYRQHQLATIIERMLALEVGINWQHYDTDMSYKGGEDFMKSKPVKGSKGKPMPPVVKKGSKFGSKKG